MSRPREQTNLRDVSESPVCKYMVEYFNTSVLQEQNGQNVFSKCKRNNKSELPDLGASRTLFYLTAEC